MAVGLEEDVATAMNHFASHMEESFRCGKIELRQSQRAHWPASSPKIDKASSGWLRIPLCCASGAEPYHAVIGSGLDKDSGTYILTDDVLRNTARSSSKYF